MKYICIGKFVNTHGLKGEIRIISDFESKDEVFKVGNDIYIDDIKFTIESYRIHKNYDMVTLTGINSIEQIQDLKGKLVYINKDDYNFDYVLDDLIGYEVYANELFVGIVSDIVRSKLYPILRVEGKNKFMVPYIDNFITNVDTEKRIISINYIKGLYDED